MLFLFFALFLTKRCEAAFLKDFYCFFFLMIEVGYSFHFLIGILKVHQHNPLSAIIFIDGLFSVNSKTADLSSTPAEVKKKSEMKPSTVTNA